MHEHSLMADLMKKVLTIAHKEGSEKVVGVKVKLGALSHISPDHFREHFVEAARGSAAEGARIEVEVLTDINDPNAQEILLDSVEVEE